MTAAAPDLAGILAQLAQALTAQSKPPAYAPEPDARPLPARVLLTVEEAAQQLGIGRTKTFELISNGDLGSVQIGRLRRVPTSAITEYAARLITEHTTRNAS